MRTLVEQGRIEIRVWDGDGVVFMEPEVFNQMRNIAALPVVVGAALMADGHVGVGGPVGAVVVTRAAVVPSVTGVDLGSGVLAVQTDLLLNDLEGTLPAIRARLEDQIPVGGPGVRGSWAEPRFRLPARVERVWGAEFDDTFARLTAKHPSLEGRQHPSLQLGSLGGGNHFVEVCGDESGRVWLMLHSGSRGVGNRIGTYFIAQAREVALKLDRHLPDRDLGWLDDGTALFADYIEAVGWAQRYASRNRDLMMERVVSNLREVLGRQFRADLAGVNNHHNYLAQEHHDGQDVWVTRKGAVSARAGQLGVIPGAMGQKSYIVEGLGSAESYTSCSHGAGRRMSRGAAKRAFTVEDLEAQTAGVECRKDAGVIDEAPGCYKDLDAVMAAQADLVRPIHTLKAVLTVKG